MNIMYKLTYKVKKTSRTNFYQTLYGRITGNATSDKTYYVPGVLDNIKYLKTKTGEILLNTIEIDLEPLIPFCDKLEIATVMITDFSEFKTGKEKWKQVIDEKNLKCQNINNI